MEIQTIERPSLQRCLTESNRLGFAADAINSGMRPPESAASVPTSELFILTFDYGAQKWVVKPRGNNQC